MGVDCSVTTERGASLSITVTAENTGSEPVELTFSDGQTVEVIVRADGEERFRYGEGMVFTQAVRTEVLSPGERLAETVEWDDPDDDADTVAAWLCTSDADCRAETAL
ncbi:hypothetical protein GJ629_10670 [Halapricum sp. CBA1109]|uniref:BsuPI-related putative proteinase inhibitor n=1 Tax=Halapricum sp. CBA1109 TaxID=2668068 RepID=UPI0012F83EAF|nr:BsuPI-related putative proteinase inhibitor [Halapricum sp. CBA1109]MUV90301.1 hypothetical protein [Halapricum sp. CBA1109]